MTVVIHQHRALLEAFGRGDPDAAEHAMRVHLSQIKQTLPVLAARYPDLFEPEPRTAAEPAPVPAGKRDQRRSDKPAAHAAARRTPA